jgi:hypothetical protein
MKHVTFRKHDFCRSAPYKHYNSRNNKKQSDDESLEPNQLTQEQKLKKNISKKITNTRVSVREK